MNAVDKVKYVAELAREVAKEDNIDFGMLAVDDQPMFDLMAISVIEEFDKLNNLEHKELILLATITKLIVENTVLNLKLIRK